MLHHDISSLFSKWLRPSNDEHQPHSMKDAAITNYSQAHVWSRRLSPIPGDLLDAVAAQPAQALAQPIRRSVKQPQADDLQVDVPLRLQLGITTHSRPDIRLSLLHISWGNTQPLTSPLHVIHPPLSIRKEIAAQGNWRPVTPLTLHLRRISASDSVLAATDVAGKAAALLAMRLLCPGVAKPLCSYLAAAGACQAAHRVGRAALRARKQRTAGQQGTSLRRTPATPQCSAQGQLIGCWVERACGAGLLLWLGHLVLNTYQPHAASLLEQLVTLMAVASGYAETRRAVGTGRLQGYAVDAAWKARHRWAAQLVSNSMTDLYPSPPLKPLLDAAERVSICVGMGALHLAGAMEVPLGTLPGALHAGDWGARPLQRGLTWDMSWERRGSRATETDVEAADPADVRDQPCNVHAKLHCCPLSEPEAAVSTTAPPLGALVGAVQGDSLEAITPLLYGKGDHVSPDAIPLSTSEQLSLIRRGLVLLLLFLPFIVLGPLLLLTASKLNPKESRAEDPLSPTAPSWSASDTVQSKPNERQRWATWMRRAAFWLLLQSCRQGGAAFIKWGQWASSREDVFPKDLCVALASLQDRAPTHSFRQSKREIEQSLQQPLHAVFRSFETKPLASGSIAQVHKAELHGTQSGSKVAVKVRHPGVAKCIWMDFQLLQRLAGLADRVGVLKGMGLQQTVSQFSATMLAQADLRVEAAHLQRFYNNFAAVRNAVTQPKPLRATESVLLESFEPGESVARFIERPTPWSTAIVAKGVDLYLKMLLQDNFVHTDLHAGNILVRTVSDTDVQLILLDFGLAEELTPEVRYQFISFLNALPKADGKAATRHLLHWSSRQTCSNVAALEQDIQMLLNKHSDVFAPEGIDLNNLLKGVLQLARKHQVTIDSNYASLVIGVCVIVGFATSLDPDVNLMDAATPCLYVYNLTGKVLGRLYG